MLLVSTDAVFVRLADTDSWTMTWLVSLFALPVYVLLNARFGTQTAVAAVCAHPLPLLGVAVLMALTQLSFVAAIANAPIANVVAIVAAGPVFAALGGRWFLGERSARRVWLGIGLSALGIALIVWPSLRLGQGGLGEALALLAIIGFSASLLLLRRYPSMSRYAVLACSAASAVVLLAPLAEPLSQPLRVWACAAAMGLLFNTAGRLAHANAPRFAPSAEVALFNPVETVAATVWGWWLFQEVPTLSTALGAAVVIAGVMLGTVAQRAGDRRT